MVVAAGEALIFDAVRTPRGRGRADGGLHPVRPVELVVGLVHALRDRNPGLDPAWLDDLLLGIVTPVGEQGADLARTAALAAGLPDHVAGVQLNRFCASGLEAVNLAAQKVRSGWDRLVLAGGVESMSRVAMGSDGNPWTDDPRLARAIGYVPQGISADLLATLHGLTREQLDGYALGSQERAAKAIAGGYFTGSVVPVADDAGEPLLAVDEHPRPQTTRAALAALRPAFAQLGAAGPDAVALGRYPQLAAIEHLHTAGNSSGIVDGAALVLIGNPGARAELGLRPRARVVSAAVSGSEPTLMLTGPVPATRKALAIAGLELADIDLFEVNEAFAAVPLWYARELGIDPDRMNVNGGAIALGHPLGATGAILIGTLLDELERRDLHRGLVTMCVGGGMGVATLIERL